MKHLISCVLPLGISREPSIHSSISIFVGFCPLVGNGRIMKRLTPCVSPSRDQSRSIHIHSFIHFISDHLPPTCSSSRITRTRHFTLKTVLLSAFEIPISICESWIIERKNGRRSHIHKSVQLVTRGVFYVYVFECINVEWLKYMQVPKPSMNTQTVFIHV